MGLHSLSTSRVSHGRERERERERRRERERKRGREREREKQLIFLNRFFSIDTDKRKLVKIRVQVLWLSLRVAARP